MAFLIPDNLRSRTGVPSGIRRIASAFLNGLDEDAVLWYEPPYDPTGEKPHLVLLLPKRGIIVFEVLELTGGGLLGTLRKKLRIMRDGREVELSNPIVRASHLAETLKRRVAAEARLEGLTIPVVEGAIFPSLSKHDATEKRLDTIVPLDRCLFKAHIDEATDGNGDTELQGALARICKGEIKGRRPPDLDKILHGVIQPESVIGNVAPVEKHDQLVIFRPPEGGEDAIRVLDLAQEALAKNLGDGHRVIRGVAGSGKTLVLVYRAQFIARAKPRHRVLVTCYTRSLAGQLRALLDGCPSVDVDHVDSLMASAIKAAKMQHPRYVDGTGDAVAEAAREALEKGFGKRYGTVLLDEAQDFGTPALRFVVGLLNRPDGDLVIAADAAQNIFRRKFSWKQAGITAQGRTRTLKVNYRNTREILEFAWQFLQAGDLHEDDGLNGEDEMAVVRPEAAARTGPASTLSVCGSVDQEIAETVRMVREWVCDSDAPRQVAVIYPESEVSNGRGRAEQLRDALLAATLSTYWLTNPNDGEAKDHVADTKAVVVLTTIHSAKGLEFPGVVMCGVSSTHKDESENRKLAYVGMTRAMERLHVVAREDDPLLDDLKRAEAAARR